MPQIPLFSFRPPRLAMDVRLARAATAALAAAALLMPLRAAAWGADGHRLVATLAESRLEPAAKAEAARLLALEPGASFSSVSTWADEVRDPATAPWHYVNFTRGAACHYDAEAQCAGGQCVVSAIERQRAVLASSAPDAERLLALKYLIHFVADVHQPLHAGYADDRGGNGYQLQLPDRGSNLHAVWDSVLIRNWPGEAPALRAAVLAQPAAPQDQAPAWAEASCRVVAGDGFYPVTHVLEADYAAKWQPVVAQQLGLAAQRLATLLNAALGASAH